MQFLKISVLACLLMSCSDEASSQQSNLAPESSTFVVTGTYTVADALNRRLSLIMPTGDLVLFNLEGTSTIDMLGMAIKGNTKIKDGYEHIDSANFKPLKIIKNGDTNYSPYDLVEYESGKKIGSLEWWSGGSRYILSEVCTGTAEKLCTLTYDKDTKSFAIKFLPETVPVP